jgi:N,N'-diacetylchitobiose transport system permease protein
MTTTEVEADTRAAPPPTTRRRFRLGRNGGPLPYLLIVPAVVILAIVAAYPTGKLVVLAFQDLTQRQLLHVPPLPAPWVGFRNFTNLFTDSQFWTITLRTVLFTALNVGLSVVLGMALASLLRRVSRWARLTLTIVMLFAWVLPSVVSSQIFLWLFDNQYGVINWLLSQIPGVHMQGHNWLASPTEGLYVVATGIVVWGALPFLAITLHAGMTQIPSELIEAARVDGARAWHVFRYVTLPALGPLLLILTTLSIIWDFGVFNQIWTLYGGVPPTDVYNLGILMYMKSAGSEFSQGSAVAVVMMIALFGVMILYIRQLFTIGDAD